MPSVFFFCSILTFRLLSFQFLLFILFFSFCLFACWRLLLLVRFFLLFDLFFDFLFALAFDGWLIFLICIYWVLQFLALCVGILCIYDQWHVDTITAIALLRFIQVTIVLIVGFFRLLKDFFELVGHDIHNFVFFFNMVGFFFEKLSFFDKLLFCPSHNIFFPAIIGAINTFHFVADPVP